MSRQAAEIIAFHFWTDIENVKECRYQPTVWKNPAVYTIGDGYFAAPSSGRMPTNWQKDGGYCGFLKWEKVGEEYGRPIFRAITTT